MRLLVATIRLVSGCAVHVQNKIVMHPLFFLLDSKSGSHRSEGKADSYVSRGTVRDAEGRSAGLPLTVNIPPCLPKKKEKASVKISTSLNFKTRFTWEPQSVTVQSDSLAGLTNPQFQRAHKKES